MTARNCAVSFLEEAGRTSHVAIVARALGIPAIGQANGIVDLVDPDDEIIVDGSTGEIFVRPSQDLQKAYAEKDALLRQEAGAVCSTPRFAVCHQEWRHDQSQHQCGLDRGHAAPAGIRC